VVAAEHRDREAGAAAVGGGAEPPPVPLGVDDDEGLLGREELLGHGTAAALLFPARRTASRPKVWVTASAGRVKPSATWRRRVIAAPHHRGYVSGIYPAVRTGGLRAQLREKKVGARGRL